MKQFLNLNLLLLCIALLASCSDEKDTEKEFTGQQIKYDLVQGSEFPVEGEVTFKERTDQKLQIEVRLSGTEGDAFHPVHLHYGDLSTPDAEMAAQLNDLSAKTGESVTILTHLMDESAFRYNDLLNFEGSVKVHLSASGEGRNIVLAGGNIGTASDKNSTNGRVSIAVCQSE